MQQPKPDLLLHPVRMRIMVTISGRQMTAQQLVRALPDVPQTTLYRHLNTLAGRGMLAVVAEHRVRGTVERVYAVAPEAARLTPADLATATGADHLNYFSIFMTSLLSDFARYVAGHTPVDVGADGVAYIKGTAHLTDAERLEFQQAVQALLLPLFTRPPAADRRPYLFATTFFPAEDGTATGDESSES